MEASGVPDIVRLQRRLTRERAARVEAEHIAERTLTELYDAVQDLTSSRALLDETTDFVAITDPSGHPTYLNPAMCELLGLECRPPYDIDLVARLTQQSQERLFTEALPALHAKGVWRGELAVQTAAGRDMPVSHVMVAHPNTAGRVISISSISRDVTEHRELTDLLAERALHDPLTGLPNRRLLYDRLDLALARADRSRGAVSVLFLDLDRFKAINDTHGHSAGDQVLLEVAHRLSARMRTADTLARIGGDEFVLLAEGAAEDEAAEIARRLLETLTAPILIAGVPLSVGVSIGAAVLRGGRLEPDALVRQADAAMYAAKQAGRGGYRVVLAVGD